MKILTMAASAVLLAFPAGAMECGPRADILGALANKYGETRRSLGLSQKGLMEVFASPETGTWTVTGTTPNGITCIILFGENFEQMPQQAPGDPA